MRSLLAFAAAVAALALAACTRPGQPPAGSVPDRPADIRGTVTRLVPREGAVGWVMVEARPGEEGGMRDHVLVTRATRVLRSQAGRLVPADWGDLRQGQPVEAWYTGPVAESDPRQATAAVLVIRDGAG